MRKKKISIAMAVYNGEKYLKEQIDSIVIQMEQQDELIISYDPSTDSSYSILKEYSENDKRIVIYENNDHSKGLVSNFENALKHCTGDIIFYSDQDDIWLPEKLYKVYLKFLNPDVTVVIHDCSLVDDSMNVLMPSTFAVRGGSISILKNLIRLSYVGCSLAFRGDLLKVVLPLATKKRSHDWWTGSICSCYGKMEKIDEVLILHRMHGDNATPNKRPPLIYQISVRYRIISQMLKRRFSYKTRG